jgi:hypothetical protein
VKISFFDQAADHVVRHIPEGDYPESSSAIKAMDANPVGDNFLIERFHCFCNQPAALRFGQYFPKDGK